MRISAICAMSQNKLIGNHNRLPWYLPADLQYFKQKTLEKPIIMGRKTYESIGKPLPHRQNIVMTQDPHFKAPGCVVAHSIEEALIKTRDAEEVFIIGGATLYQQTLPMIQRLYITLIHKDFDGDVFFPEIDWAEWVEIERIDCAADAKNLYDYSFLVFERRHETKRSV